MDSTKRTICIDFDGTIHKYSKGWHDGTIYDGLVDGAKEKINLLHAHGFRIVVFTTRATSDKLVEVEYWLNKNQVDFDMVTNIKIPALAYIDDRAIRFTNWEDMVKYFV